MCFLGTHVPQKCLVGMGWGGTEGQGGGSKWAVEKPEPHLTSLGATQGLPLFPVPSRPHPNSHCWCSETHLHGAPRGVCLGCRLWPQRKNWSQRKLLGHREPLVYSALSRPKPQGSLQEGNSVETDVSSDLRCRSDPSLPTPGNSVFLNTCYTHELAACSFESLHP